MTDKGNAKKRKLCREMEKINAAEIVKKQQELKRRTGILIQSDTQRLYEMPE
jgi:hypothetical protein